MVAEITLSLVLLTRAGIAVRGLLAMQNQSLGYNPKHALTFLVPLSEGHYTQWANRLALYQNVADKLRRSPQVTVASISATGSPLYGGFQARAILAVRAVDRNQPTLIRTLESWLNIATAYQSFSTFLFGVFGTVDMLLATAGVFSVVSYSVEHRTREFGIRMALGANPRDVLKLVLASTGRLLAFGLAIGIALSILASRTLATQMEGMCTENFLVFLFVPSLLIIVTSLRRSCPHIRPGVFHPWTRFGTIS